MKELYIDLIQQRKKNNLAIHNEHILNKHFPELGKLARLSNIRLDIEEALNSEVPEFILN